MSGIVNVSWRGGVEIASPLWLMRQCELGPLRLDTTKALHEAGKGLKAIVAGSAIERIPCEYI